MTCLYEFTMYVHINILKITTIRLSDIWNKKVYLKYLYIFIYCDYWSVGTEQFLPNKVSLEMYIDPSNKTILIMFTLKINPF